MWIELHADGSPCDDDKLEIGVTLYQACPPSFLSCSLCQQDHVCVSQDSQNIQTAAL